MINIRIANLMGLSLDSAQHSVAIDEALISIEDTEAFYQFLANEKDSITTYGKDEKPERLMTLTRMYKKLQEKAKLPHETAMNFSKQLTHKVEQARTYIKNLLDSGEDKPFSRLHISGEPYFSKKEISALSMIGRSEAIIELSELYKLEDNLIKLFLSKYITKSKYEALTDGQQQTKHLIENAIKG